MGMGDEVGRVGSGNGQDCGGGVGILWLILEPIGEDEDVQDGGG